MSTLSEKPQEMDCFCRCPPMELTVPGAPGENAPPLDLGAIMLTADH